MFDLPELGPEHGQLGWDRVSGSGRRRVVGALLLGGGFEIEQRDERAGKHPEDGHAGDHDRDLPGAGGEAPQAGHGEKRVSDDADI